MKVLFVVLVAILCMARSKSIADTFIDNNLKSVLSNIGPVLQKVYDLKYSSAKAGTSILGLEQNLGILWQNDLTCATCSATINSIGSLLSLSVFEYATERIIVYFCSYSIRYEVCDGTIREMGDSVWSGLTGHILRSDFVCARAFGFCSKPKFKYLDNDAYIARVLKDKPDFIKNNDYVDKQYEMIRNDTKPRKTIKVMHATDIHVDLEYTEGYDADCGEPICCRKENGFPKDPKNAAGKYGDFRCDLANITMHSFFDFAETFKDEVDLIFWTGDNIAHDIWMQSVEKNAEYTKVLTDVWRTHFPDTPVFPILGNHEFFPVNVQRFDGVHPVIDRISEYWADWIGPEGIDDFKNYGYYNIPLKGVKEDWSGYRVIGLNTESCNDQNWYLISQMNDPSNHIKWLEEQFVEMEKNNEKAFIIGHVIPCVGCLEDWSERYRALIERYQHLVITHFFGHQHVDNFFCFKDTTNTSSISTISLPGGVNTNGNKNPTFRIYEVDYETRYPVKGYKYYFNLTAANLGNPKWEFMHEVTEKFKIPDLSPSSYLKAAEMIRDDQEYANMYLRNRYSYSNPMINAECTGHCQHNRYCETANAMNKDYNA